MPSGKVVQASGQEGSAVSGSTSSRNRASEKSLMIEKLMNRPSSVDSRHSANVFV